MPRKYIGICGLDCETCEARIATATNDDRLRREVAEKWSRLNNIEILPEMIQCDGCRLEGRKTIFCDQICEIRQCALAKGYNTCGDCANLETCATIHMIASTHPESIQNLKE